MPDPPSSGNNWQDLLRRTMDSVKEARNGGEGGDQSGGDNYNGENRQKSESQAETNSNSDMMNNLWKQAGPIFQAAKNHFEDRGKNNTNAH